MSDFVKTFKTLCPEVVVDLLGVGSNSVVVDCTYGSGGHAEHILMRNPLKLYVVDYDSSMLNGSPLFDSDKVVPLHMNFKDLYTICAKDSGLRFSNILVDLGVGINQIFDHRYGLSYDDKSACLNMVVDNTCKFSVSAYHVVNYFDEKYLYLLFSVLGEEKFSRRIVDNILYARKKSLIKSTGQLCNIVSLSVPSRFYLRSVSNVFRALRMYVNSEVENIIEFICNLSLIAKDNCRLVFITFHSIEDRIVKNFFLGRHLLFNNCSLDRLLRVSNYDYSCRCINYSKRLMCGDSKSRRLSLSFTIRYADIVLN